MLVAAMMAGDTAADERRQFDRVMGKDDFLKLLSQQLRYQDPLEPVKDTQFVAQLAQFSALEQMQNLGRQMDEFMKAQMHTALLSQGASLLGRKVELLDPQSQQVVSGTVNGIKIVDGVPKLLIGNGVYSLADVTKIEA